MGTHGDPYARWATAVLQTTECVVVSVDYRLAPRHPFPTGIEDCVSAILYLWANAKSLHLDVSRTALSGFSAGGNYSFTAPIRLHQEIARFKAEDRLDGVELGKLVGIVAFYPAVDWTRSRAGRAASNPNAKPIGVPKWMAGVFDESYLYPRPVDMWNPLLSPGLADEELLKEALPEKVCFVTCWGDGLLGEGEAFRERLRGMGSVISGYTVPEVVHGWDKWPSWGRVTRERDEAYRVAGESLKDMFG
ncbi:Arylesterase [Lachnellula occidentalis]|uniref:Arylesterase n=1 Tax=Lachnellula occidentalis TaxID=215460 RepID=A0A8H8S3E4_9HELO|nr:Arylesterase [Lachnellula occidentalis]